MDRRTLLALALAIAVIALFDVFHFGPQRKAVIRAKEENERLEKARADSLALVRAAASDTSGAAGISRAPEGETAGLGAPTAGPGAAGAPSDVGGAGPAQRVGGQPPPAATPLAIVGGLTSNFILPSPLPPSEIKVETGLYEATFTSRGGLLKSMKLKQFKSHDDSLVDLVRSSAEEGREGSGDAEGQPVGGGGPQAGAGQAAPVAGPAAPGELGLVISSDRGRIDLSNAVFAVTDSVNAETGQVRKLTFVASDAGGASVSKTYTFAEGSYTIGLDVEMRGVSSQSYKVDCLIGWTGGLSLTETNVKEELRNMKTVSLLGTEMLQDDLNSFKKTAFKEHAGSVKWTGVRSRYFIAALIPAEGAVSKVFSFGDPEKSISGCQLVLPVSGSGVTQTSLRLYLGPIDLWRLQELQVGLERVVNMGWSWIRPVSQLVLWFLVKCQKVVPNYGIVIIILSALTKVLFHPLTKSSMKSMRQMQKLQPEIQKLREKHKGEAQKLNKEVMALYKREKINPLGGCLPLLLQMPVFIALYSVLMNSIEMRRASFVWWINDLSSPDTVAVVAGFAIHLLPILMAATMFWQQKMTPTDPRQAAMTYFMPVLMLVFFYGLPSGLVLYWTANNAMTIGQNYILRKGEKKPPAEAPAAPTGKKKPGAGQAS